MSKPKLIRITTIPFSLNLLLRGQLAYMREQGFEVVAVSSAGHEQAETAEREKIRTETVEMSRRISPFQDLKSLWQMYWLLKKEKPQIVHTHTPKAGLIGMLASKLSGVPVRLHTVAGLPLMETSGLKRRLLCWAEKMTCRCATKVYPNSKGLPQIILSGQLSNPSKLKVILNGSSNGIDTRHYSPDAVSPGQLSELKQQLGIGENDFVFVFVGRLVGDKGINELVSAFSKLKIQNSKLILVGPAEPKLDPLRPETLKLIESHPNIKAVGFQQDVRPYFGISNALTFPSYREGFPNVVMQAGAMGLPCIVSDINGCNEIIIDGINGLIIPSKQTEALKNAMQQLITDTDAYNKMKSAARELISSRYEQQGIWEAYLEEYSGFLKRETEFSRSFRRLGFIQKVSCRFMQMNR